MSDSGRIEVLRAALSEIADEIDLAQAEPGASPNPWLSRLRAIAVVAINDDDRERLCFTALRDGAKDAG